MELLSFTYLIIELCLVGAIIYGAIALWWLAIIAAALIFVYPFAYETILKIFYTSLEVCFPGTKSHHETHADFKKFNWIVYDDIYNLRVLGIEKQHPFDACKYERAMTFLLSSPQRSIFEIYAFPGSPDYKFLYKNIGLPHLIYLNYSVYLSKVVEIPLCWMPSVVLRLLALRRFLYATQGTLKAACMALEKQVAINLGGGFHHAHANGGSGFCFYNDIGLAIEHLWKFHEDEAQKILIIDLDAHQGNGHERDKIHLYKKYKIERPISSRTAEGGYETALNDHKRSCKQIFIIDAYNPYIFPHDSYAKQAIDVDVSVTGSDSDETYLSKIQKALDECRRSFVPDFIIYNAGTDILAGDRLGNLSITEQGVIKRDELVFKYATDSNKPIMMLLSGGYQRSNAPLIGRSIINLANKFPVFGCIAPK